MIARITARDCTGSWEDAVTGRKQGKPRRQQLQKFQIARMQSQIAALAERGHAQMQNRPLGKRTTESFKGARKFPAILHVIYRNSQEIRDVAGRGPCSDAGDYVRACDELGSAARGRSDGLNQYHS